MTIIKICGNTPYNAQMLSSNVPRFRYRIYYTVAYFFCLYKTNITISKNIKFRKYDVLTTRTY